MWAERIVRRAMAASIGAGLLAAGHGGAWAGDRPTLAGIWSTGPLQERWSIGDWGDACGPRPTAHGPGGGSVTVTESGSELRFSSGGYGVTTGCYDMGPGVRVTSHTASPRSWHTECSTAPNDSRQARLRTNVTATDSALSLDETGEYQFVLKGQNCTASVRRSRTYSLLQRAGEAPPVPTGAAPASPVTETPRAEPPPPPSGGRCASPGDPVRLDVRPARKVLRPGENFSFRALVLDAAGCRSTTTPTWTLPPLLADGPHLAVTPAGAVTVAADSGEGETVMVVAVGGKTVSVVVNVVTSDHYRELLATGAERTSEEEVATAVLATPQLGTAAAVAEDTARRRKHLFLWILAGCGSALVLLAWWLKRRAPATVPLEEMVPVSTGPTLSPRPVSKHSVSTPPVARPAVIATTERGTLCPVCGTRYGADAKFCGREGAVLVRLNLSRTFPRPARYRATVDGNFGR